MTMAISVDSLDFAYSDRPIFKSIGFTICIGESVALLGRNGSGKTTLIKLLSGLLRPNKGAITIIDRPVTKGPSPSLYVIFSEPDDQIVMSTVYGELALGLVQQGLCEDEINRIISESLMAFDLTAYTHAHPHDLSTGEKKRLLLATAMSLKPRMLILDEPFAGLDVRSKNDLVTHIASISATKLIVTHEYAYAHQCCQRALVLHHGQLHDFSDISALLNDQQSLKSLDLI